jgi:hypothetical protein
MATTNDGITEAGDGEPSHNLRVATRIRRQRWRQRDEAEEAGTLGR